MPVSRSSRRLLTTAVGLGLLANGCTLASNDSTHSTSMTSNPNFYGGEAYNLSRSTTSIHPESLHEIGIEPNNGMLTTVFTYIPSKRHHVVYLLFIYEGRILRDYMLREEIITNDEVKSPYAWFFWRYLTSVALIMGIVILALVHEDKGGLTRNQKYIFNSEIIMLTLMLGLNMTVSIYI